MLYHNATTVKAASANVVVATAATALRRRGKVTPFVLNAANRGRHVDAEE
jgi:hypothetical protein